MTDEELCKALRMIHEWKIGKEAADRIEALVRERNALFLRATLAEEWRDYDKGRAEAAEALIADCADYMKEGETPRQRMDRDHKDVLALMDMLAKEKMKREAAEAALKEAVEAKMGVISTLDAWFAPWARSLAQKMDRKRLTFW